MKKDPYMPSCGCDHCGKDPVKYAGNSGDYCSIKCLEAEEGKPKKPIAKCRG